jgi:hypothetical protein
MFRKFLLGLIAVSAFAVFASAPVAASTRQHRITERRLVSGSSHLGQYTYPAVFRRAYMHSCTSSLSRRLCGCTLRWLERHISFRRIMREPAGSRMIRRWANRAAAACTR